MPIVELLVLARRRVETRFCSQSLDEGRGAGRSGRWGLYRGVCALRQDGLLTGAATWHHLSVSSPSAWDLTAVRRRRLPGWLGKAAHGTLGLSANRQPLSP